MSRHSVPVSFAFCLTCVAAAQEWVPVNQTPFARREIGMVTDLTRSRIVMFGGKGLTDTWVYDGCAWTEHSTTLRFPRIHDFVTAFDATRGQVVVFGGRDAYDSYASDTNDTRVFTDKWTQLTPASSPPARRWAAMAHDTARGETVLFGGYENHFGTFLADTWVWDGATWVERTPATSPPAMGSPTMAYDAARQRIVLVDTGAFAPATWEWDGITWLQTAPTMPPWRRSSKLVYRPDTQRILLVGGERNINDALLADTWEYDGASWTQVATTTTPPGIARHGIAWDPITSRVTLFGGIYNTAQGPTHGDMWVFEAASSAWVKLPTIPQPYGVHGMAYDSGRSRLVALTQLNPSTWEFDGAWHPIPSALTPPFVYYQPIVYDSWRQATVTFSASVQSQTWEWRGTGWQTVPTKNTPPPRLQTALAFDPVRGVVVMFGGYNLAGAPAFSDTWEYDGIDWTQRTPATHPPGCHAAVMAFHPGTQQLVLFGGKAQFSATPLDTTWTYDGITWTPRTGVRPPSRAFAALAQDPATDTLILSGGLGSTSLQNPYRRDAWRWDGSNWSSTGPQAIDAWSAQSAAADSMNAMMCDGTKWWRWTETPAVTPSTTVPGCGTPASSLVMNGRPYLGDPHFRVHVQPTLPNAVFAVFFSGTPAVIPLGGGCTQFLADPCLLTLDCASATGQGTFTAVLPRIPSLRGCTYHVQAAVAIPQGPLCGVAGLTDMRTVVLND